MGGGGCRGYLWHFYCHERNPEIVPLADICCRKVCMEFVCVCVHGFACMLEFVCVCLDLCVCVHGCVCMPEFVCVCAWVCVCVCVRACACCNVWGVIWEGAGGPWEETEERVNFCDMLVLSCNNLRVAETCYCEGTGPMRSVTCGKNTVNTVAHSSDWQHWWTGQEPIHCEIRVVLFLGATFGICFSVARTILRVWRICFMFRLFL